MEHSEAEQRYREQGPVYEVYVARLRGLLGDLLSESKIPYQVIEGRAKTLSSFVEKITRSGKKYEDPLAEITDLAGLRVVLFYLKDIERVTRLIRDNFAVDEERSLDKRDTMSPEQFGYQSLHIIVSLDAGRARLPEWRPFAGLVAEIQIRTVLQHAWAAISHKLQYKRENEIPRTLRRRLYRLSGLFELADDEFDALRDEQTHLKGELAVALRDKELDIEISRDSLVEYLQSNKNVKELTVLGRKSGVKFVAFPKHSNWTSELLEVLGKTGIRTIAELDIFLRDSLGWGKPVLARLRELQYLGTMSLPFFVGLLLTAFHYETLEEALPNVGNFASDLPQVQELITRDSALRRPTGSSSQRRKRRG